MTGFRRTILALFVMLAFPVPAPANDGVELLSVRRIWDKAPHNAFTSLIRFQNRWVCAFREAPAHVGPSVEGKMRVIFSADTEHWDPVALLEDSRGDIRDAKLSVMPDGRLMLLTATHVRGTPARHQSVAWFTKDLKSWEGPVDVGESNIWLWGIRWHKGVGYSIGYSTSSDHFVRLYKTTDGRRFEKMVERLEVPVKFPNESAMVFDAQDVAHVLLRADPDNACIGRSAPPYTNWTWKQTNARVGGPAMMQTASGRLLGGGRLHDGTIRAGLFWVDPQNATIMECLKLPSGGDTSYPGLVFLDGVLYVSYYSSHEGKTSIYLAKCRLPGDRADSRELDQILIDALGGRGEWTSVHAAEALIELGRTDVVRAAFVPQAGEVNRPYRIGVWRVLAECARDDEQRTRFVERIRSVLLDIDAGDRVHAMESLAKLHAKVTEAERSVVQRTAMGNEPGSPFAAWRLAEGGAESAQQRLVEMLSSGDEVTRARAADALGHPGMQSAEARRLLEIAANKEPLSSAARPLMLVALGGDPVRALLADTSPAARYHAAMHLGRQGRGDDVAALARLRHDSDADVRVAAAFAVLNIRQRESKTAGLREREDQTAIDIGSRRELFVDRYLIERMSGTASLRLHPPIDRGPVLQFDAPWEGAFCAYVTILHPSPDKYQMYYRGMNGGSDTGDGQVTCYAESADGIHWVKPQLDLKVTPPEFRHRRDCWCVYL